MIDWLTSKLKGQKHYCWECKKYIFNDQMDYILENNNLWCEGGGFCCPIKGFPYFIGRDKDKLFCTKFKFRKNNNLKEKFL